MPTLWPSEVSTIAFHPAIMVATWALLLTLPSAASARQSRSTMDLVPIQSEPSEVTFNPSLILEADITPHALFRSPGGRLGLELTPKVILRVFNEDSAPVRSPSFMPRATLYVAADREWQSTSGSAGTFYSFRYGHHSNGLTGDFYNPDGSVNVTDGSFSTNFLEAGMHRIFPGQRLPLFGEAVLLAGVSFEQHMPFIQTDELAGQYSSSRLHTRLDAYRRLGGGSANLSGQASYLFGRLRGESATSHHRFAVDLAAHYRAPWFQSAGFYLRLYSGPDYYNMRFAQHILTTHVGLALDFATWGPIG